MEGARKCCPQVRRLLPHEYIGLVAWGPKKGRLINGVQKQIKGTRECCRQVRR
jgi:hypothetical protein